MADNYSCVIQPRAVTAGDTVEDFKITLDLTGDDQGMLHNPEGYCAEDISNHDSGKILAGTDYFYLIFPLGNGRDALIPQEMGEEGELSCTEPGWSVASKCVEGQRRFTLMPPPGTNPARSLILYFREVLCNSVPGQANIDLRDKNKKLLAYQFVDKCPIPVIEKWEQERTDPYNIGESGNLRCKIRDYSSNDFRITLDGKEIPGKSGEFLVPIQSLTSGDYTLAVKNNAETAKTVTKSTCFDIAMIESFILESVHNDKKVKFSWEVNSGNADPAKGVHIEYAGDSKDLKSTGTEFVGTFSEDKETDFVLTAYTKDCQRPYTSQPQKYTPPVINKFEEVPSNKMESEDLNCRKLLGEMAGDNDFLDARELCLHLEDREICTGFLISCRGKYPVYHYNHTFEWELNKECDCTVTLGSDPSQSFSNITSSGTCTLTSNCYRDSATLKVVDAYGYENLRTAERQKEGREEK